MSNRFIALDMSSFQTRMGYIRVRKKDIEILSLGVESTAPEFFLNQTEVSAQQQSKVIKDLYANLNLQEKHVAVIIPDSATYSQILVMPKLKEEELVNSIRIQADEFIPLPIDSVYIDVKVISELQDNKLLALIVAGKRTLVDHIRHTLDLAGLEAYSLENEMSALGRFTSEVMKPSKKPSLIVNFGYEGSTIYLLNPQLPHFQLIRKTNIGLEILIRDIKLNNGWTEEQALTALKKTGFSSAGPVNLYSLVFPVFNELLTEIDKTISQAKSKYNLAIENIFLYNYDNAIANLHSVIQNKTSLKTEPFPLHYILKKNPITNSFHDSMSSFTTIIAGHIR